MTNSSKLLLVISSALILTACNSGSSPSSSNSNNSNGYSGALVESYSVSLPNGGTLNTTQNLVFPAESNGTTPLYFNVSNITESVNIDFAIQQTSSSSLQQKDVSAGSLPTISSITCNFTLQNESCTLTLSLNNSAAGSYSIIPTVESPESALTPIPFTNIVPGNYFFGNGTYSVSGIADTVSNNVCTGNVPLPVGSIAVVNGSQICFSVNGGTPACSTTPSFFNTTVFLPQNITGTDTLTGGTYYGTLSGLSNGSLYFYQTEAGCEPSWGTFTKQ